MEMKEQKKMYAEEFKKHLEAGDDELNAKLRIIEHGCSPDIAEAIAEELSDDE